MQEIIRDVKAIYELIGAHSMSARKLRASTKSSLERRSDWSTAIGVVILVSGFTADHFLGKIGLSLEWTIFLLVCLCLGVLLMLIGVVLSAIDARRTTKRPLVEHIDRIVEALPIDTELIKQLTRYDTRSLEFARRRLSIESTKVRSRLDLLGGGTGMKASTLGVALLACALVFQYSQIDFSGLALKDAAYLGTVVLLAFSIAACFILFGVGHGDFYSELIDLAIEAKKSIPKEGDDRRVTSWRRRSRSTVR
jgi:hypothetical protein